MASTPSKPRRPADQPHVAESRVTKRLNPGQPGTRRLQRRFGPALVCVRYREDAQGTTRFTTVELVVEHRPALRKGPVRVEIRYDDAETRRQAMAHGAEWDNTQKTWHMPRQAAIKVQLITNRRRQK
ncbi:MAG: hypothetical protein IV094_09950 [Vitreoscilla sp.]|nr:hypothetical protein [Vitreoscilla sp.]